MSIQTKRINRLRGELQEMNLDGLYVTNLTNVRYLSGFSGSAAQLLFLPDGQHFFTDGRYDEQSKSQVSDYDIHMIDPDYFTTFAKLGYLNKELKLGLEAAHLPLQTFRAVSEKFPKIQWVDTNNLVEPLAAVKDSSEIEAISEAAGITDRVFKEIIKEMKVGSMERNIAARVSYLFKTYGADGDAYDPIIASGPNSALPHATPGNRKFKAGDFVVMDIGAQFNGYCADLTRTVVIGDATDRHHEIYNIVLESHLAGLKAAKAGITGVELDKVCRDVIEEEGYGPLFNHSTGHGLGLEVHTYPRVSKVNDQPLLENYVVTIEPGIYIPGWGGVRIEDDVWIKRNGCTSLNRSTKELLELK